MHTIPYTLYITELEVLSSMTPMCQGTAKSAQFFVGGRFTLNYTLRQESLEHLRKFIINSYTGMIPAVPSSLSPGPSDSSPA